MLRELRDTKLSLALSSIDLIIPLVIALRSTFRPMIALLTIAAWMLASNHCAVGEERDHHATSAEHAVAPPSGPTHCPAPSEQDDNDADLVCCSSLQAPVAQSAKDLPAFDQLSFVPITYFLLPLALLEGPVPTVSTEWDTGPPNSFAESVIQRCLPSNAPPTLS